MFQVTEEEKAKVVEEIKKLAKENLSKTFQEADIILVDFQENGKEM